MQSQNEANMATSSTLTAAGTTMTAQSTAASTAAFQEPIVQHLGHVTQGARPERKYDSQPYFSGQQYTAASGMTAAQPCTAVPQPYNAAAQPYIVAPYNNNNMPAMSARPAEPMGDFGQGGQLPFVLTEEQLLQQQQLLREKQEFHAWSQAKTQPRPEIISERPIPAEVNVEVNVDSSERSARARPKDQVTKKAKAKRAGSASTSQRSPSPKRDYPRGTCTVTRPSRASPRKLSIRLHLLRTLKALRLT